MNGSAQIFSGLISWAVYHMDATVFAPWRLFIIVCAAVTLVIGVLFWFFIPDNPMEARFLTHREKVVAIERLRAQSSGVENKTWKREQFIETLTDWKPWAVSIATGDCNSDVTIPTRRHCAGCNGLQHLAS